MKNILLYSLLIVFILTSCQFGGDKQVNSFMEHEVSLNEDIRATDRPIEIPPNDIWIMETSITKSLKDLDNWYNNSLQEFKEEPYYQNLKSISLSMILQHSDIKSLENIEVLKTYLLEEVSMNRIANIDLVYDGLEYLKANTADPNLIAKMAKTKLNSIRKYITSQPDSDYLSKNEDLIQKLEILQFDRWGNNLSI